MFKKVVLLLIAGAAGLISARAEAQTDSYVSDKDVQVAVRAFSFAYGMPKGDIQIEIVFDPGSATSSSDAGQISKIIGNGGVFANRAVKARMVTIPQMGSTGSRLAYVTHGMESQYDGLLERAKRNKMLLIINCLNPAL